MKNPVVHFEIYADNPAKLRDFYTALFDWKISEVPNMDYWTIRTVDTDDKNMPTQTGGINGGMMKRPMPDARSWMNYVTVQSLDGSVERAQKLGATILRPKSAVPKMGWFAIMADPQGNAFAMWQNDRNAR